MKVQMQKSLTWLDLKRMKIHQTLRWLCFVDFSKAFDLTGHNVLLAKYEQYNLPPHITAWFLFSQQNRQQFVKTGNVCSQLQTANAGAPSRWTQQLQIAH